MINPFSYILKGLKYLLTKPFGVLSEHIIRSHYMKSAIVSQLVSVLLSMLSPDLLRKFTDNLLDFVENFVLGTASDIDDKIVLPLCQTIRATFGIPDNDVEKVD